MKKYFFILLTLVFISSSINTSAQKKSKYFNALNQFEANDWLTGNFDISNAFEESYQKYHSKKNFKKHLLKYIGYDLDKIYWVATYLNDDYYNEIKDENLSFEIFKYGIAIAENAQQEKETIRFLFIVGKIYYHRGEKETSLTYLIPAYELSQKYPGNVPTWNTATEADEIYGFIKENI